MNPSTKDRKNLKVYYIIRENGISNYTICKLSLQLHDTAKNLEIFTGLGNRPTKDRVIKYWKKNKHLDFHRKRKTVPFLVTMEEISKHLQDIKPTIKQESIWNRTHYQTYAEGNV